MKLCKDCIFCELAKEWTPGGIYGDLRDSADTALRFSKCVRKAEYFRRVGNNEEYKRDIPYCSSERHWGKFDSFMLRKCGKSGKYWIPRK